MLGDKARTHYDAQAAARQAKGRPKKLMPPGPQEAARGLARNNAGAAVRAYALGEHRGTAGGILRRGCDEDRSSCEMEASRVLGLDPGDLMCGLVSYGKKRERAG